MIVGESLQMLRYTGHIRFKPHFLEAEALVGYEDIKLISTNKSVFNMNPLIFASISNLCYRILEESESDNGSFVIHTELSDLELYKICKFGTTGKIYCYKSVDELLEDGLTVRLFQSMGVNLCDLRFTAEDKLKENNSISYGSYNRPYAIQETPVKRNCSEIPSQKPKSPLEDEQTPHCEMEEAMDCSDEVEDTEIKLEETCDESIKTSLELLELKSVNEEDKPLTRKRKSVEIKRTSGTRAKKIPLTPGTEQFKQKRPGRPLGYKLFWFPQDESLRDLKKSLQCSLCVRGFDDQATLKQHIRRHSAKSENDRYFCLYCEGYKAFAQQREMLDHIRLIHADSKPFFNCPHCKKRYPQLGMLNKHVRSNHVVRHAQCSSCGTEYANSTIMRSHLQRMGPYHDSKCRICPDFEAKSWDESLKHINTHHDGEVQFKCGFCPEYFVHKRLRLHHLKHCKGGKAKEFEKEGAKRGSGGKGICPHCAKECSLKDLQQHINRMHGTHNIPCTEPGCNRIIKHPDAVREHMKNSHASVFCSECGIMLPRRKYRRHREQVHMTDDKRPFQCDICKKGFVLRQLLDDHRNTHTGKKPHKCPECGQGFASEGTMYGHLRNVHKGIKRKR